MPSTLRQARQTLLLSGRGARAAPRLALRGTPQPCPPVSPPPDPVPPPTRARRFPTRRRRPRRRTRSRSRPTRIRGRSEPRRTRPIHALDVSCCGPRAMLRAPRLDAGRLGYEDARYMGSCAPQHLCAVEMTVHPETPRPDVRLTLPARAENVAVVRHMLGAFGASVYLPDELIEDLRLAVT